jgi:deoxyribodipyrimidine photo-lyase
MFWFRRDLRVSDNLALTEATGCNSCFYYHSTFHSIGLKEPLPPSEYRRTFENQSLTSLEENLRSHGKYLFRSSQDPIQEIPMICSSDGISTVFCSRGFSWHDRWQENALKRRLEDIGVRLVVIDSERFPWKPPVYLNPRSIFTDYKGKMEALLSHGIPKLASNGTFLKSELFLPSNDGCEMISSKRGFPSGGEYQSWNRIHEFVRKDGGIEHYLDTRNGMLGYSYSSVFSPFLAMGCCTSAQIYEAVKEHEMLVGASKSTYWIIFELLWRSYFRWISEIHGSRLFVSAGYNERGVRQFARDKEKLRDWIRGKTSEPLVNACMRELGHTGFMGNRARQIAASYLIHDLGVDWTWGARYFEHMLIDYDACSNYGNWCYLAGVGSDPRPLRRFNPLLQQEKYDPDHIYVNHWLGSSAIELDDEYFEMITM